LEEVAFGDFFMALHVKQRACDEAASEGRLA
jgi:hypothetical protein